MRSHRIATVLTVLGITAGGGAAVAMAAGGSGMRSGSAAVAQYGCPPPDHDLDHGKCERHGRLVHRCKRIHWHSKTCREERRELRHHHR